MTYTPKLTPSDVGKNNIFAGMRELEIYLVSTDHLEDRLWFREDADFKVGMNYAALVSAQSNVRILAFILMSNHVHFVLEGTEEDARSFISEYKRRYSKYYQGKYGVREFLRGNGVDIRLLELEGESLERAIAYVQMNCVAANICMHPSLYPWGTGPTFFNPNRAEGKLLMQLSRRAQVRILNSKAMPPKEFRLTEEGYIDPSSYVNVPFVERLFRTPSRFNYFLQNSSKAKIRLEENALPSFRDQSILTAMPDLCRSLFRKSNVQELSRDQLGELLKQLRFRFSADVAQLSRIMEIPYEEVARLLDSM